jgi:hypothetical protein
VNARQRRWLDLLLTERQRRLESPARRRDPAAEIEAELAAMAERILIGGGPWSPADASIAERVALFGRWPPGTVIDADEEEAAIEAWFISNGYAVRAL